MMHMKEPIVAKCHQHEALPDSTYYVVEDAAGEWLFDSANKDFVDRTLACVNACAGIGNEALESGCIGYRPRSRMDQDTVDLTTRKKIKGYRSFVNSLAVFVMIPVMIFLAMGLPGLFAFAALATGNIWWFVQAGLIMAGTTWAWFSLGQASYLAKLGDG